MNKHEEDTMRELLERYSEFLDVLDPDVDFIYQRAKHVIDGYGYIDEIIDECVCMRSGQGFDIKGLANDEVCGVVRISLMDTEVIVFKSWGGSVLGVIDYERLFEEDAYEEVKQYCDKMRISDFLIGEIEDNYGIEREE